MLNVYKKHADIILSYGLFLGWLLSFPFNGPVLELLKAEIKLNTTTLALVFTFVPVLFLIAFSMLYNNENYCRQLMVICSVVGAICTILILTINSSFLYIVFAVMGICCVVFIISWSYYFTYYIAAALKIKIMSLVIITGNLIYYIVNISAKYIEYKMLVIFLIAILTLSMLFSKRVDRSITKIEEIKDGKKLPKLLIVSVCAFFFLVNLNGGVMFHAVYPYFRRYEVIADFYTMIPYIITLVAYYFLADRVPKILPAYLGTVLLGISYVAFAAEGATFHGYIITETLAQSGWAMLDLFLWTLLGEIAYIYGGPLKICSYGMIANLSSVFAGAIIGIRIFDSFDESHVATGLFAISIVLLAVLGLPLINNQTTRFVANVLNSNANSKEDEKLSPGSVLLRLSGTELLTAREREVAGFLISGIENIEIAKQLSISENTLKVHARRVYAKLEVANKKELIQLILQYDNEERID